METSSSNGNAAQGADTQEPTDQGVPELATIEKWMQEDLGRALTFLHAVNNDAELKRQMAVFMRGRVMNFRNKPDPNQMGMDFGQGPKVGK